MGNLPISPQKSPQNRNHVILRLGIGWNAAYVSIFYSIPPHNHQRIGGLDCRGKRRVTRNPNTFEVLTLCSIRLSRLPGVRHDTVKIFNSPQLVFTQHPLLKTLCSKRVGAGKGRDGRGWSFQDCLYFLSWQGAPMLVYVRPSNEALLRARVPGAQDQRGSPSIPFYRGGSASKEDTWPLPPILLIPVSFSPFCSPSPSRAG